MSEVSKAKELKEKIFMNTKPGITKIGADEVKNADAFCEGYKPFLDYSRTERDAVKYSIELAEKAGFTEFDPAKTYNAGDRVYVNNRDKALMLAVMGNKGVKCQRHCKPLIFTDTAVVMSLEKCKTVCLVERIGL